VATQLAVGPMPRWRVGPFAWTRFAVSEALIYSADMPMGSLASRLLVSNPYGMSTLRMVALKLGSTHAAVRWLKQRPGASAAYPENKLEGVAKASADRPSSDPYCKSVLAR